MLTVMLLPAPGLAQEPAPPPPGAAQGLKPPPAPVPVVTPQQAQRAKLNKDTLIIATSRPGTSYLAMANDLSSAIGSGRNVRVLPVAADGGLANLRDALFLRGVDMAIVSANVLAHAKRTNALGSGLAQKVAYLTALHSEEVHVVAGQGAASVEDLRGKRVAVPADDGTAQFTAGDIFQHLGIAVESVPMEPAEALEAVRTGAVQAAVLVASKPLARVAALPKDGSLRLLSLPFSGVPGEGYSPAVLLPEDYPALIPPGVIVESVAVKAVLVVGKGGEEAGRRIARHTPALLDAIAQLATSQRHPRWKDVNLGAVLAGWSRVEAAETWLRQVFARRREALQGDFDAFLRGRARVKSSELSAPQRKKLFDDFEVWARQSATSGRVPREPAVK
jgi:TRAP-type uncharacterized transport system substrate-binding protein